MPDSITFYARAESELREISITTPDGESVVVDFTSGSAAVTDPLVIARLSAMAADPNHPVTTEVPPSASKQSKEKN